MIAGLSRELGIKMGRGLTWKKVLERWEADGKEIVKVMEQQSLAYRAQQKVRSFVNAVFNYAVEERLIAKPIPSPFAGLEFKKTEEKVPEILTLVEIKRFLDFAKQLDSPWYSLWATVKTCVII